MSSDSDHTSSIRHHSHKRKKVIISDSDSSDDSIIVQNRRNKKIYRVVSEEESSDDSDVPKPVIRRQNHRVISEDESSYDSESDASKSSQSNSTTTSEWEDDWTSSDEMNEDAAKTKAYRGKSKVLSKTKTEKANNPGPSSPSNANVNSDSSDEQSEKCPICLLPFNKQQVGTPSVCGHCFCLECLLEWSRNINTCPVDRQTFTVIHVRDHLGGKVVKHLPVEVVPRVENQVQDDPTFCEICNQSDREDRMLLCDGCDRGYHLECLTPPMTTVPIEEWFCPECVRQNQAFVTDFLPTLMRSRYPVRRILRFDRANRHIATSIFATIFPPHGFSRNRSYARNNNRNRSREVRDDAPTDSSQQLVDPYLPSTSSGIDSIGDNSRSRSPNNSSEGNASSSKPSKSGAKTTKRKKKKHTKSSKRSAGSNLVREVRIREFNEDGEEEEIVTYVKVASTTSRRKCKKRTKKTRKVYR